MPQEIKLVFILAAVIALAVCGWLLYRFFQYRAGKLGKMKVQGVLKRFGVIRNYKILEDVHLSFQGKTADIDHMLIGFFGILFVSTVNDTAEYYGDAKGADWTKVIDQKRVKMENLMQKNIRNIDVVRMIFSKNGMYNIHMEGVTVFCGGSKKTLIGITGAQSLMTLKQFKAYITKTKFEKDNNVDVPALTELIERYRVKSVK